ncbi:hypothetical protein [Jatrophihabitans endophyticus]|uniref:hypothetical protein n=1 Tax=Jatrophihabitans endophyticus TaxID=1206085 RepID=UPI001A00A76A|nr:hypothetical protein [Jatrophihabitans endophyticus]MBE7187929.1 hypothetical protein [Jatrophihabitans endophyticus]
MSRKLITTGVGAGVAGLLTLGICVAGTAASAAADRPLTTYHIGDGGAVHGPSHIAPGLVGMHITGAKHTIFQIAKSRHGAGKSTVLRDLGETNQGQVKNLEDDFRLIGGTPAHGNDFYVTLNSGTYYALDVDAKKPSAAKILKITVSGARSNSAQPAPSATITSRGNMKWGPVPNRIPASGYLQFVNHSTDNANNTHFIDLERLQPGKKYGDVKKVFEGKEPPNAVFASGKNSSLGTGVISPRRSQVSTYSLKPGRYMLACFFPDRMNGQPHAFMGMYRTIVVG